MTATVEKFHHIFVRQRWYNYGSIGLSLIAALLVWVANKLGLHPLATTVIAFWMFGAVTLLAARVRVNPLIRCTIENADHHLYSNLWLWSLAATAISISTFVLATCLFIDVGADLSQEQQYIGIGLLAAVLLSIGVE